MSPRVKRRRQAYNRRERISNTGKAHLLCPFHHGLSATLNVWPGGRFYCVVCGERGVLEDQPDLLFKLLRLKKGPQLFNPIPLG